MCAYPKKGSAWCSQRQWNSIGPSITWPGAARGRRRLGRERGRELRVAVVARGRLVQRAQEPLRRLARAGRLEIHPERLEDLRHRRAVPHPVLRARSAAAAGRTSTSARRPPALQVHDASSARSRCRRRSAPPCTAPSAPSPERKRSDQRIASRPCYARRSRAGVAPGAAGEARRGPAREHEPQVRLRLADHQAEPEHRELRREPEVREHLQRRAVVVAQPRLRRGAPQLPLRRPGRRAGPAARRRRRRPARARPRARSPAAVPPAVPRRARAATRARARSRSSARARARRTPPPPSTHNPVTCPSAANRHASTSRSDSESRYRPSTVTRPDARASCPSAPSSTRLQLQQDRRPARATPDQSSHAAQSPTAVAAEHHRRRRHAQRQQHAHHRAAPAGGTRAPT